MKKTKAFLRNSCVIALALAVILSSAVMGTTYVRATGTDDVVEDSSNSEIVDETDIIMDETEDSAAKEKPATSDENKDETEDTGEAAVPGNGEASGEDETDIPETEDGTEEVTEDPELTEDTAGKTESGLSRYANYCYGDPADSWITVFGTDEDGNEIFVMYENDLDEIIRMAEEGMDLSVFFTNTVFAEYTLDDLYALQEEGISLAEAEEILNAKGTDPEKYINYTYGDPFYNNRILYGYDENGDTVYYMYADDVDEIIAMVEDGMDLTNFFKGTAYVGYTLETLCDIRDEGLSIAQTYYRYTTTGLDTLPDSVTDPLGSFLDGEINSEGEEISSSTN